MTEAHLAECLQRLEETRKTLDQIGTDLRGAQEFRDAVFDLLEGTPFGAQADSTYDGLYGRLRAAVGAAGGPPAIVAVPYVIKDLAFVVAQLRHAYQQIHDGRVSRRGGMKLFADGLIAPQIRRLEKVLMQGAEGAPPALYQEPEKPTTIQELWDLEEKHPPFVGSTGRRHRPEVASPAPPAETPELLDWLAAESAVRVKNGERYALGFDRIGTAADAHADGAYGVIERMRQRLQTQLAEAASPLNLKHAELEIAVANYRTRVTSLECGQKMLEDKIAELEAASSLPPVPVEACPACGAEPGCNIDCMWCKWIAAVRALPVETFEPLLSEAVEWIERLALSGANHGQNESEGRCEWCRHLWSQHAVDCEVPAVLARLRAGRSVDFLESVNAALSSVDATHRIERNDSTGQAKAYRVAEAAPPTWQDIRALIAEWRSSANFIADVLVPTPEGAQDEFRLRNCADALEKLLPAPPQDERTKP